MPTIKVTKEEAELIKQKRKEKADYNKMMHEKPTIYTGKSKGKVRLDRRLHSKNKNEIHDIVV